MKISRAISISAILLFGFAAPAFAQFSENVVGYINLPIRAGDNLIANQLYAQDNTLNGLFGSGTPDGSSFLKWDIANHQFLPASTYSISTGWSINYDFHAGEGAIFHTSVTFTNTFVGDVHGFNGGDLAFTYPTVSSGEYLLSCSIPYQSDFFHVIGRDPYESESVRQLDSETQTYRTTTFQNGVWDSGDPVLRVGESAFFSLVAPASPVPEPRSVVLLAGSILALGIRRFSTRRKQ